MNKIDAQNAVACVPGGVPAAKRKRWIDVGIQIYAAVEELRALPDGFDCRLPGDADTLLLAAEYITLDRLCCTFARWELRAEPKGGPVWLRITGPEGTKELTTSTFETVALVRESVLRAAGLRILSRTDPRTVIEGS